MAEKMIAYCGLICSDCGAYVATQKNDNKMRREVADWFNKLYKDNKMRKEVAEWRAKKHKHDFKPEEINCDGCTSDGRLNGYCSSCSIRKCGKEKSVSNCGLCLEYPCKLLDEFFKTWPDSKKTLDAIELGER